MQKKISWLERVEQLVQVLEGSTVAELELSEDGTEITIRREPGMTLVSSRPRSTPGISGRQPTGALPGGRAANQGVAIVAPLTGVYYAAPSPTSPPFCVPGDVVQVGQVVALVEAMKVFNEIQSEISGRVVSLVATGGSVVRKGDVLLRVEPL